LLPLLIPLWNFLDDTIKTYGNNCTPRVQEISNEDLSKWMLDNECDCPNLVLGDHRRDCSARNLTLFDDMVEEDPSFRPYAKEVISSLRCGLRMYQIMDVSGTLPFQIAALRNPFVAVMSSKEFQNHESYHSLRINFNHLNNELHERFVCQSNDKKMPRDDNDEVKNAETVHWMTKIKEALLSALKCTGGGIKGFVTATVNHLLKTFNSLFGMSSEIVNNLVRKFENTLVRMVTSCITPGKVTDFFNEMSESTQTILGYIAIVVTIFALAALGWIAPHVLEIFSKGISSLTGFFTDRTGNGEVYVSQAGSEYNDPIALVTTCSAGLMSLGADDAYGVKEKVRFLSTLVAGGTAVATLARGAFFLLPVGIKEAISCRFASQEEKDSAIANEWICKTTGLIKVSRVAHVMTSDIYNEKIKESMISGRNLMKLRLKNEHRAVILQYYMSLLKVETDLSVYKNSGKARIMPWAIHLHGKAGVGKSLVSKDLFQDIADIRPNQVFGRSVGDVFWSGFINQLGVLYDEWLIGNQLGSLPQIDVAKEYLELVSGNTFKPNLASLDAPAVGIKGTEAKPRMVMTVNNTPWNYVEGVDPEALHRRRQYTIGCYLHPQAKLKAGGVGEPDLNQYSVKEIRETKPWMVFTICGPVPSSSMTPQGKLSPVTVNYKTLVGFLKNSYLAHRQLAERLANGVIEEAIDPKEAIEDALRDVYGIPDKPQTITEALGTFLSGCFKSQGGKQKREKKAPKVLPTDWKIAGRGKDWLPDVPPSSSDSVASKDDECPCEVVVDSERKTSKKPDTAREEANKKKKVLKEIKTANHEYMNLSEESLNIPLSSESESDDSVGEPVDTGLALNVNLEGVIVSDDDDMHSAYSTSSEFASDFTTKNAGEFVSYEVLRSFGIDGRVPAPTGEEADRINCQVAAANREYELKIKKIREKIDRNPEGDEQMEFLIERLEEEQREIVFRIARRGNPYQSRGVRYATLDEQMECVSSYQHVLTSAEQKMSNITVIVDSDSDDPSKQKKLLINYAKLPEFEMSRLALEPKVVLSHEMHRHYCQNHIRWYNGVNRGYNCQGYVTHKHLDENFKNIGHGYPQSNYTNKKTLDEKRVIDGLRFNNTEEILCDKCLARRDVFLDLPQNMDETYEQRVDRTWDAFKANLASDRDMVIDVVPLLIRNAFYDLTWPVHDFTNRTLGYVRSFAPKFESFGDFREKSLSWLCEFNIYVGTALSALMLVSIIYNLTRAYFAEKVEEESELITFKAQTGPGSETDEPIRERTKPMSGRDWKNSRVLHGQGKNQLKVILNGHVRHAVPIKDRWVMTFLHGFDPDKAFKGNSLVVELNGRRYNSELSWELIKTKPDSDLLFINLVNPEFKSLPTFSDSRKQFITEQEYREKKRGIGVSFNGAGGAAYGRASWGNNRSYSTPGEEIMRHKEIWVSNLRTADGDCGLPLISVATTTNGKTIGIHVAGSHDGLSAMAAIVTKEMLDDVVTSDNHFDNDFTEGLIYKSQGVEMELSELIEMPNVHYAERIRPDQQIMIPNVTKIKPSGLKKSLEKKWVSEKGPAVLKRVDPRGNGTDPIGNALVRLADSEQFKVPDDELDEIFEAQNISRYNQLIWPIKRELTFVEALRGIPGILAGLKLNTSPGWPLVKHRIKQGKKDFVWFENGEIQWSPMFKEMVMEKLHDMEVGEEPDHVWLGYMKDELVSKKKIDINKTRIIFASSLVATVAFRMKFGAILAAYHASAGQCNACIGINQYSLDMQKVYDHLSIDIEGDERKFVAGDYECFDIRHQKQFRDRSYVMICEWAKQWGVTQTCIDYFIKHETESPCQLKDVRMRVISAHFSGNFFTTPLNCEVNEAYIRWCFMKALPCYRFDDCVRLVTHGDDMVMRVDRKVHFDGRTMKPWMALIGQNYTSDNKDPDPGPYRCFEDITFLGAHPIDTKWGYTGALKKRTLETSIQWTRNEDATVSEFATQFIELASQWDELYWREYRDMILMAMKNAGIPFTWRGGYAETRRTVAFRTTDTSAQYPRFVWQSGINTKPGSMDGIDSKNLIKGELGTFKSRMKYRAQGEPLTVLQDAMDSIMEDTVKPVTNQSLSADTGSLHQGTEGFVYRDTIEWKTTDPNTTNLKIYDLPRDMLALPTTATDNLQNMPFSRYMYWRGGVEIALQINGTPFQQGLVIAYFQPLSGPVDATVYQAGQVSNLHVFLNPNGCTTTKIHIPYRYFRHWMNTVAIENEPQCTLGSLVISVYSRLRSIDPSSVDISVYSRFPGSQFSIPRIRMTTEVTAAIDRNQAKLKKHKHQPDPAKDSLLKKFSAQGQGGSRLNVQNNYNIGDVAGDMPIETSNDPAGNTLGVESALSVPFVPMDNPPLASGAVPTYAQYSGMSKSNGVEPTVTMQLHPQAMYQDGKRWFGSGETSIESLTGRWGLVKKFAWLPVEDPQASIFSIELTSILQEALTGMVDVTVPPNVAVLNEFTFWRADIEFAVQVVRTRFQVGRLAATIQFGNPAVDMNNRTVYFNQVLDFMGDSSRACFTVPWNAQTEFLRTWEGTETFDYHQNHSLGFLELSVLNRLVANAAVPQEVEVLLFVRFKNTRVAVPRMKAFTEVSEWLQDSPWNLPAAVTVNSNREEEEEEGDDLPPRDMPFHSQGLQDVAGIDDSAAPLASSAGAMSGDVTSTTSDPLPTVPCKISSKAKFEYTVSDVREVMRRQTNIVPKASFIPYTYSNAIGEEITTQMMQFEARPLKRLCAFFGAWSGTLKYRILREKSEFSTPMYVNYNPLTTIYSNTNAVFAGITAGTSTFVQTVDTINQPPSLAGPNQAREVTSEDGLGMLDFSIPFQTHFNYLGVSGYDGQVLGTGKAGGIISVTDVVEQDEAGSNWQLFHAIGDDFNVGIYRSPKRIQLKPLIGTQPTGVIVNGYYGSGY